MNVMKPGASPRGTLAGAGPARRCRKEAGCHGARRVGPESNAAGCACDGRVGAPLAVTTALPEAGGLAALVSRIDAEFGGPVYAAIESMNGARFVHDQLELAGWQVEIADAQKVKGLAPLACKTDKIDSWV